MTHPVLPPHTSQKKTSTNSFFNDPAVLQIRFLLGAGLLLFILSIKLFPILLTPAIGFYLLMVVLYFISTIWLFNKLGLSITILFFLGILLRYGPFWLVVFIYITVIGSVYLSMVDTPIDFAITKDAQGAFTMGVYQTIWVVLMVPIVHFLGASYILSNLTTVYMGATFLYVVLLLIFQPLLAHEPLPGALINGTVMVGIEYAQLWFFGVPFFNYIMAL